MNLLNNFTYEDTEKSFLYLQEYMMQKTVTNDKFFIGRLSGNETNLCGKVLNQMMLPNGLMFEMRNTAGIHFTSNEDIKSYVSKYTTSCKNCDVLGIWSGGMYNQAKPFYHFLDKLIPNTKRICAQALEPFYYMKNNQYSFNNIFVNKKVRTITI